MARHGAGPVVCALAALLALAAAGTGLAGQDGAWLGVLLDGSGDDGVEGVRIGRVVLDSPAHQAGLRARDTIRAVDGRPVRGPEELVRAIQARSPGAWVELSVSRDGRERELRAQLDSRFRNGNRRRLREGWVGLEAIDLPPALRLHFGATAEGGVMISAVEAGSPAEAAGFRIGDVLYGIDGHAVGSTRDMQRRIAGGGVGNICEFDVARYGAELELAARLIDAPTEER